MTPQEIESLAMTGAATIVAAMATDAWSTARECVVELFHRRSPDQRGELEVQLDANAALVSASGDADRARTALLGLWQLQLEGLLDRRPEIVEELTALTTRIQTLLPVAGQQFVQHNSARDHGIVNAVQHGTQKNYFMDPADSRPLASLAPDEASD